MPRSIYPAFVAEMALPANRPKLQFGVWSGFAIVVAKEFAVPATLAYGMGHRHNSACHSGHNKCHPELARTDPSTDPTAW